MPSHRPSSLGKLLIASTDATPSSFQHRSGRRSMGMLLAILVGLTGVLTAACGSDGSAPADTSGPPVRRGKPKAARPPVALLGTYTTTLKSKLPAPTPPELRGQRRWTLKITNGGGIDNAPTLTIVRPPSEVLESSTLSVSGNMLELSNQECAQRSGGDKIVTSSYRWTLKGNTLQLTAAKRGCPDKVARTILTSEPWTRS
jgi:hypothetical protein